MIRFQLRCDRGDSFEAWFRNNPDYDLQRAGGQIACPACGSAVVEKAIMAPAVLSGRRIEPAAPAPGPSAPAAAPETPVPVVNEVPRLAANPELAKAMEMMREIGKQVRANSDYVGPRFAEEARKIHYKEAPPRRIYGEATGTEVQELAEEGIGFQPLPVLPEERN